MGDSKLIGKRIAIELLDGTKVLGTVHSWGIKQIWVLEEGREKPIEVPRDIIQRSLVLFEELKDGSI